MKTLFKFVTASVLAVSLSACGASEDVVSQPVVNTMPIEAITANWTVDKTASTLSFSSSYDGEKFSGFFSNFDAQIQFDPSHLNDAKILVTVDLASVDAQDAERTDALSGKDWFFVKTHPQAKFEAHDITHVSGNQYRAEGILTLRGVSKPLTLDFDLDIKDGVATMSGVSALNRRDFDIGRGAWKSDEYVAYQVGITVALTAHAID
ncbi:MAG: polyisoprenoid-binding protein [Robiginitomaculum sp.]|nr:MAG: polyisoprenoid-binding protein [Robiginitomaculum sp.]